MGDASVMKVAEKTSPVGEMGQKYLASGVKVAMRLWEEEDPSIQTHETVREYETVGYVLKGKAELELEGQKLTLKAGDSWVVPKGARHRYTFLEKFSAIEATSPPAQVKGRDEPQASA